jgi:hypothetical protein
MHAHGVRLAEPTWIIDPGYQGECRHWAPHPEIPQHSASIIGPGLRSAHAHSIGRRSGQMDDPLARQMLRKRAARVKSAQRSRQREASFSNPDRYSSK